MSRVRKDLWWAVPPFVIAAILGAIFGYALLWLAYTAFNVTGVWLYVGGRGSGRLQLVLKVLTILLLPVGVYGVLASGSGLTVTEAATVGSSDEDVRKASAGARDVGTGGPGFGP